MGEEVGDEELGEAEAEDADDVGESTCGCADFGAEDTLETFSWEGILLFEGRAEGTGQWAAVYFPELGDGYLAGIYLTACTHGGEEGGSGGTCFLDKERLAVERVDGVNHVIVVREVECWSGGAIVFLVDSYDFGSWIDGKQPLTHFFDLGPTNIGGRGDYLSVEIAFGYGVEIDDSEVLNTRSHQCFSTPAAYSTNTKENDTSSLQPKEIVGADELFGALEGSHTG